jgi:hypothetical protein
MRTIRNLLGLALGLSVLGAITSALAALAARNHLESHGTEADDELDLVTIYDGLTIRSTATALRRVSLLCWYGGGTLDLRGAALDPGGATITLRALFGGVRLVIPATWRVEPSVRAIFGGAGDVRDRTDLAPDAPVLRIRGWAVFGGVGILSDAPDLDGHVVDDAPTLQTAGAATPS